MRESVQPPSRCFMRTPSRCTANRSGFTLIELLVVVAVISILTSVGLMAYSEVQKSARDQKRRGDLEVIKQALELYRNDHGKYPTLDPLPTAPITLGNVGIGGYFSNLRGGGGVPVDPLFSTRSCQYFYMRDGTNPAKAYVCAYIEGGGGTTPSQCSSTNCCTSLACTHEMVVK